MADEIVQPGPTVYPVPAQSVPRETKQKDPQSGKSMLELMRFLLGGRAPTVDEDVEEIQRLYNEGKRDSTGSDKYEPVEGSSFFSSAAQECGEAKQKECAPDNFGGRTMCGMAVARMLKCMAPVVGAREGCTGGCGHGKDFVNCNTGQMEKCGYTKLPPTDSRCKMAGAVLAYAQSPTARGQIYGHVEFVCGNNRFCSVYKDPHDRPWPRYPADSCWYPASQTGRI